MSVSVVQSTTTQLTVLVDDNTATITYIGEAPSGSSESAPVWRIKRLETVGTVLKLTWADGNQFFDNDWSNRTSYSYS